MRLILNFIIIVITCSTISASDLDTIKPRIVDFPRQIHLYSKIGPSFSQIEIDNPNININSNSPEIMTNNIYTPAFLREQIGKLVRVEFLIGTNNLVDRVGILQDVGASYILLQSIESNTLLYCDIYSIKFVVIASVILLS